MVKLWRKKGGSLFHWEVGERRKDQTESETDFEMTLAYQQILPTHLQGNLV
jgi:hypothetical protein